MANLNRGDRITITKPIFNKNGAMVGSIGQKGIVLNVSTDETASIKLDRKHYPINYAPVDSLTPTT